MKATKRKMATPTDQKLRRSTSIAVIFDVALIIAMLVFLLVYISSNNGKTYRQNVDNIQGIAQASSRLVSNALDNTSYEIKSAFNYCDGKSIDEILDYLSLINSSDTEYQLLCYDEEKSTPLWDVYSGYSTRQGSDGYTPLSYKNSSMTDSLDSYGDTPDGTVAYSQNFSNKTDGLRYFAVFCGIRVQTGDEYQRYFLVKPQKESRLLDQAQLVTQYEDVSLAICDKDGRYLASENSFRANNFFDYIYEYNNLSIDEKNEIRDAIASDATGHGTLTYLDYQQRDCVFSYADCGEWLVIVSVPTSEFVSEKLLSFFPLMIILFLLVFLIFNVAWLLVIVKELRLSVRREIIASASKSSFLSRMSHEIRTPLNAIIGYNAIAQTELQNARDDTARRQMVIKVSDCMEKSGMASKHLLTIINDVLDMSAIEGGKIIIANDRFDFKGLISSLTTVFYSQASTKGITFEVVFGTLTEEWFLGDQMRVNQILTNLLSNAIKFTPSGGAVTLKIHQPDAETDAAHIHFEVTDTGIGMAQEYLSHIWTPFEQADSSISRRFGGSGLGLSITKNLVDLMGGTITVQSTPGAGTTFSVDLTFEKTEQPQHAHAYDFSTVRALVVDDDPSACDYIRLLFNRCGARCAAVTSGGDALKAISIAKENGELYSICLVDWKMPQMSGLETIAHIRELIGDELPLFVLTAYDFAELSEQAQKLGVDKFLSKPLFQSSLFDLLTSISNTPPMQELDTDAQLNFGGARILLAEDNEMNMEIAKTIMESAGLQVDSAWNGREAVEKFLAAPAGRYMTILMDVHMPEMDGHEATRTIRASAHPEAKTIPIIAMTADAFAENVAEAHAAGMNDHISKPIDIPTLFETLQHFYHPGKTGTTNRP